MQTSPQDSGEVNAGIQLPGTGLPCAAHTDASMLTLITAPSQLGLEIFDVSHPMERSAHAGALAAHAARHLILPRCTVGQSIQFGSLCAKRRSCAASFSAWARMRSSYSVLGTSSASAASVGASAV